MWANKSTLNSASVRGSIYFFGHRRFVSVSQCPGDELAMPAFRLNCSSDGDGGQRAEGRLEETQGERPGRV